MTPMASPESFPRPLFWRTRYYVSHVMGKPGSPNIGPIDVRRALAALYRRQRQLDGRMPSGLGADARPLAPRDHRGGRRDCPQYLLGWRFRAMTDTPTAATGWQPVRYCVETDTMAVEMRPWPGREDDAASGAMPVRSRYPLRSRWLAMAVGDRARLASPRAHRRRAGGPAPCRERRCGANRRSSAHARRLVVVLTNHGRNWGRRAR